MSKVGGVRKSNLKKLINEQFDGVVNRFSKQADIAHSAVWRMLRDEKKHNKNSRWMGEKLARKIEKSCGLPGLWLDIEGNNSDVKCLLTYRISRLTKKEREMIGFALSAFEQGSK